MSWFIFPIDFHYKYKYQGGGSGLSLIQNKPLHIDHGLFFQMTSIVNSEL